jgi:ribosomal protein S18 acetylase RimI-like enzyme
MEFTIKPIKLIDEVPVDLLLLADPSIEQIRQYSSNSAIFVAVHDQEIVGAIIISRLSESALEIINLAVYEDFQGKGIGKILIQTAIQFAKNIKAQRIEIGTGNSSLMQLGFYQKCGFRIHGIWENHFIKNYEEEIYENGIQCRDMIRLKIDL